MQLWSLHLSSDPLFPVILYKFRIYAVCLGRPRHSVFMLRCPRRCLLQRNGKRDVRVARCQRGVTPSTSSPSSRFSRAHTVSCPDICRFNICYTYCQRRVTATWKYTSGSQMTSWIRQVYEDLTKPDLLKRCLKGRTQNLNESLHSKSWAKCNKNKYYGYDRVKFVTQVATLDHTFVYREVSLLTALGFSRSKYHNQAVFYQDKQRLSPTKIPKRRKTT